MHLTVLRFLVLVTKWVDDIFIKFVEDVFILVRKNSAQNTLVYKFVDK
jgi:hypothetical protein